LLLSASPTLGHLLYTQRYSGCADRFYCKRSVSKFCDPLRFSDLTLQDYLLWCVLITKVYKNNPHTLGGQKVNMQCEFINSDVERYKRCWRTCWKRFWAYIADNVDIFNPYL